MGDETKPDVSLAARFGAKIKGLKTTNADLTRQLGDAQTALTAATTERDKLRAQVLEPDAAAKKIGELQGRLNTQAARKAFDKLARDAGFPDGALDTLYRDSKHEAKSEEADVDSITAAVEALKTSHAWALGKAPAEGTNPAEPPAPKPIPGQGRGGTNGGNDGTLITAAHRADPKFMLNPANREVIAAAAKEHRFR